MKLIIYFGLLFITGCAAVIVYSSKEEELYYNKCGGCHRLYPKTEFTKEKWLIEVEEMSKKAKLPDEEKRMIIKYLTNDKME